MWCLYGQKIAVEFVHKIREETKFASVEKLIATIEADVKLIRQWFSSEETGKQ